MKSAGPGDLAGAGLAGPGRDRVQRGQPPREGLGGGRSSTGRPRRAPAPRAAAAPAPGTRRRRSARRRAGSAAALASSSSSQRAGRSSRVTPCRPSGGTTWLPGGSSPPSITSSRCGVAGRSSAPNRGRSPRSGRQQGGEVVERRRDHPHRPDRVGPAPALGVRQPLDPVPVGEVLLGGQHRDDEVVGGVERGRRADQRTRQRPGGLLGSARPRCGRTHAGRPTRAGRAGAGARPGAGAGPRPPPGRPGRWGCSRAAPARGRGAGRTARTARAGSRDRWARAPTPATARRPGRAATAGSGWCQVRARRCWSAASRATLRTLAR